MKSLNEFDAEALRTAAYGFLAAAFFGDFENPARIYYMLIAAAAYAAARQLIKRREKGDRS